MKDTLTVDMLLTLAAQFPPPPPPLRIIVGFPLVPVDQCVKHEQEGLLLMGRSAWTAFKAAVPEYPLSMRYLDPFDSVMGVRVEFYGDRADHETLLERILRDLTPEPPVVDPNPNSSPTSNSLP